MWRDATERIKGNHSVLPFSVTSFSSASLNSSLLLFFSVARLLDNYLQASCWKCEETQWPRVNERCCASFQLISVVMRVWRSLKSSILVPDHAFSKIWFCLFFFLGNANPMNVIICAALTRLLNLFPPLIRSDDAIVIILCFVMCLLWIRITSESAAMMNIHNFAFLHINSFPPSVRVFSSYCLRPSLFNLPFRKLDSVHSSQ